MLLITNIAVFQIGWFSSVLGGAHQMPWLGPLIVVLAVALHLRIAQRPTDELLLIAFCAAIGTLFDSALVAFGWVGYPSGMFSEFAAPYWIITMWALFATTLNVSMRWLRGAPLVAAAFGFIGGPLTYWAGKKLGGIELVDQSTALWALAFGWALMMPFLVRVSQILDGMPSPGPVRTASRIRQ